ncbi:cytochrome-c peroxidase [Hansschlegelia zhihuaiae]|uniref:Cytochrome c domain-containing protein n=1 Tax=Hansschlegelia zhihuaiae TaxID=405005 RepID=A0A4Q0MHA1_9HYPH|nr:cytochrome c peroxidase [Hansschlegelia zhihuaiae]RXF72868.1 hypothetical protein EK403_13655 [Hansschlegelia zhihuaiae]
MKACALAGIIGFIIILTPVSASATTDDDLYAALRQYGFTGKMEEAFDQKLGRTLDPKLVDVGRLVFFDKGLGVHKSNSCAGCHSPTRGFGDTQPIAIGIGSGSDKVGPSRTGARNQRRTPMLIGIGLLPSLMWNGRFSSNSGDPFDNSRGFTFPYPEGQSFFPASDPRFPHLLAAQAHIPFTELPEMAGFGGFGDTENAPFVDVRFNSRRFSTVVIPARPSQQMKVLGLPITPIPNDRPIRDDDDNTTNPPTPSDFDQFDDVSGNQDRFVPEPYDDVPSRNNPIRHEVLERINNMREYRQLFGQIYQSVNDGNAIEFYMIGQALSEFQLSLTYVNAPIDRYARGERGALTDEQKRGAILFFGKAGCVTCHTVAGNSNEMFSDFKSHATGVPSIAPVFGVGKGNVPFRNQEGTFTVKGPYDMGLFDITSLEADRFKFRTSPLRNVGLQANFFHNGSFNNLERAVRFHINPKAGARTYNPANEGVPADLRSNMGRFDVVQEHLAPQLDNPVTLTDAELDAVVAFLNDALTDERARADKLRQLVPARLPSGEPVQVFE